MSSFCGVKSVSLCVISWILVLLIWFVILPYFSYYLYKYYKLSNTTTTIYRRHPIVVLSSLVAMMFGVFLLSINYLQETIKIINKPSIVMLPLNAISLYSVILLISWRIYICHYDLAFAYENQKISWRKLIIPDELPQSKYIIKRSTYGSTKWQIKIVLTLFIVVSLIIFILAVFDSSHKPPTSNHAYFAAVIDTIINVISIILYSKMPSLVDIFYIKKEVTYLCSIGIVSIILYSILRITMRIKSSYDDTTYYFILLRSIFLLGFVSALYVQIVYVINKSKELTFLNNSMKLQKKKNEIELVKDNSIYIKQKSGIILNRELSISNHRNNSKNNSKNNNKNVNVSNVLNRSPNTLNDDDSFNTCSDQNIYNITNTFRILRDELFTSLDCITLFANMLEQEFSIENLISFIEFYQFLLEYDKLISQITNKSLKRKWLRDFSRINWSNEIPLSAINNTNNDSATPIWAIKYTKLYNKYLSRNATYQINISYHLKQKSQLIMANILESDNYLISNNLINDILPLLIQLLDSIIDLLRESLRRLSQSSIYKEFQTYVDTTI